MKREKKGPAPGEAAQTTYERRLHSFLFDGLIYHLRALFYRLKMTFLHTFTTPHSVPNVS